MKCMQGQSRNVAGKYEKIRWIFSAGMTHAFLLETGSAGF